MGTGNSLWGAQENWQACKLAGRSSNRPSSEVSIKECTVDGKEGSKVRTHTEYCLGSIDELGDGGNSVVWDVAVVGHGVETWAWSTLVTGQGVDVAWCDKGILTLVGDVLVVVSINQRD